MSKEIECLMKLRNKINSANMENAEYVIETEDIKLINEALKQTPITVKSICSKHQSYDVNCELCNVSLETPITPESLRAIGFKNWNSNTDELIYEIEGVDNTAYDSYHISYMDNKFCLLHCCEEIPLHFTSTEQILEFIKCFQAKENK